MFVIEESLSVLPGVFGKPVTMLMGGCFDVGDVKSFIVVIEEDFEELVLLETVGLSVGLKCFLMSGNGLVIVSGFFVEVSDLDGFAGFSGSFIWKRNKYKKIHLSTFKG